MIALNEFRRNQSQFPREELEKYNGQWVAWSEDGKRILAAHADLLQLDSQMIAAGLNPGDLLVAFIGAPDDIAWSGWGGAEVVAEP